MESSGSGVLEAVACCWSTVLTVWGVEAVVCTLDFVAWEGFVTLSVSSEKTYGIHNWHDRVSFCLPCVILTRRL